MSKKPLFLIDTRYMDHYIETDIANADSKTWTVPANMTWYIWFISAYNSTRDDTVSVAINDGAAKNLMSAVDHEGENLWTSPYPLVLKGGHTITVTLDGFQAGDGNYKTIEFWEVHQT